VVSRSSTRFDDPFEHKPGFLTKPGYIYVSPENDILRLFHPIRRLIEYEYRWGDEIHNVQTFGGSPGGVRGAVRAAQFRDVERAR
jgi:hypothetical protein